MLGGMVPSTTISRRSLLKTAGVTAAAVALSSQATPAAAEVAVGLGLSSDPILHGLRRTTFGPTPALLAEVRQKGWAVWVDEQLRCNPSTHSDATWNALAGNFPTLAMSAYEVHRTYQSWPNWAYRDTRGGVAARSVYTQWQLREVLVEFWSNHFNTTLGSDQMLTWTKSTDDREVITAHALGRFADLLLASAQSPAMIWFLDNIGNTSAAINENYARELLELHTLGADAVYHRSGRTDDASITLDAAAAEADVKAAARVLTGWSADFTWNNAKQQWGDHLYHFVPGSHSSSDRGPVYGWTAPSGLASGEETGKAMLLHLARHPDTARHICRKLCVLFVDDQPSDSVVELAVSAYLAHDTSILETVRAILLSAEFAAASGSKWRRPVEVVPAMIRALGLTYDAAKTDSWTEFSTEPNTGLKTVPSYHAGPSSGGQSICGMLATLDQMPFGHRTPDGYPAEPEAWLHAAGLLRRWNIAYQLMTQRKGFQAPPTPVELAGGALRPTTAGAIVDALTQRLCMQRFDPAHRSALLTALGVSETAAVSDTYLNGNRGRQLVALILSSAYFQLR